MSDILPFDPIQDRGGSTLNTLIHDPITGAVYRWDGDNRHTPVTFAGGAVQSPPSAPLIVGAVAAGLSAVVSFQVPATGGSPITGYTVTSSPGGLTASGASSPLIVTGLSNETRYTFTVTATNALGTGGPSAPSNTILALVAAPTVVAFNVVTAGNNTTTFRLTFSEPVTGVSAGDFSFVGTGDIAGSIGSVAAVSTSIYDVVTTHTGSNGTARARLAQAGHGITDADTNPFAPAGATDSAERTVTTVAPTVLTFIVQSAGSGTTTFRLTFSEAVTGVNAADFSFVGTGDVTQSSPPTVSGSGSIYDVVTTHTGANGTALARLAQAGHGITDSDTNAFAPAGPTDSAARTLTTVDTTAPTVISFLPQTPYTDTTHTTFRLTFSEIVTGVGASDFLFVGTGDIAGSITQVDVVSGTIYDVVTTHTGVAGTAKACLAGTGTGIADLAANAFAPGADTYSGIRSIAAAVDNNNRYWGRSVLTTLNAAEILGLEGTGGTDAPVPVNGPTDNDKTISTPAGVESYAYYAFPFRYGAAPNLTFNGLPDNDAWVALSPVNVTPDGGTVESYRVYRTIVPFDTAATLIIS